MLVLSYSSKLHFAFLFRYLTFFYYLNEPKLGGETAFPIADNETIPQNYVSYYFLEQILNVIVNLNTNTNTTLCREVL